MKTKHLVIPMLAACLMAGEAQAQAPANTNTTPTMRATPGTGAPTIRSTTGVGTPTMRATPGTGTPTIRSTTGVGIPTNNPPITVPSDMNSQQFNAFATSRWDTNGDGVISGQEWSSASPTWFGSGFSSWDRNNNGMLDTTEWQSFYSNSRLYQMYDTDGNGAIDATESSRIPAR